MSNNSKYTNVQILDDSESESETELDLVSEPELTVPIDENVKTKKKVVKEKVVKEKVVKVKVVKVKVVKEKVVKEKVVKVSKAEEPPVCLLKKFFYDNLAIIEIGADEVGRGPMFGRVYCGAVVLPKDDSFDHYKMKDSKKFTSKSPKRINETAEYIKQNAIAWAVEYQDESVIDQINILQATQLAMHNAIKNVIGQLASKLGINEINVDDLFLLIDGNYFIPLKIKINNNNNNNNNINKILEKPVRFQTVEGGDNKFTAIAAASILAKVERDKYIADLCVEYPELIEKYGLDSNKGYGSKKHMDGIKQYGITQWHRRTFGICSTFEKVITK
jgi:ribonuclease HII